MNDMTRDTGAIYGEASFDTDPDHWPREIERTGAQVAMAKEVFTLLKKMERPTMLQHRNDLIAKDPRLSKADAWDQVLISATYRNYVAKLAAAEKNKALWEGRHTAAKAQHEAARTYEASRRAALHRT